MGNVSIRLFSSAGDEEKLEKLKAVTYNLENGKIVESKLDIKEGVFKNKIDKNWIVKKFTFQNVKEGSIFEYEYTNISDFLENLQPWEFQGGYPRLWSEYNLSIPDFLGYVFLTQGYRIYDIADQKFKYETYLVNDISGTGPTERYSLRSNVTDYRWVIKNVNALKEEDFTSAIDNHISRIEFQLTEYRKPLMKRKLIGTWQTVADNLLKSEFFGQDLSKNNDWLSDITNPLLRGISDKKEKA